MRTLWDEMRAFQEQMDEMFTGFFNREPWYTTGLLPDNTKQLPATQYRHALTDLEETDKEVIAKIELPGVNKKDIQVNATDDGVEVKVEHQEEKKEEKKGTIRMERRCAGFYRKIATPSIDADKIKANYKDGVLELRMPKKAVRKGKQILIE
ncbi:Hsp20/alpha crystallin family protein [Candidatus Woesearchaeota archaeon]|nr:Hsp20/alpha crystallin family protein [Candidatus Woesearchaeota archaeon]